MKKPQTYIDIQTKKSQKNINSQIPTFNFKKLHVILPTY